MQLNQIKYIYIYILNRIFIKKKQKTKKQNIYSIINRIKYTNNLL